MGALNQKKACQLDSTNMNLTLKVQAVVAPQNGTLYFELHSHTQTQLGRQGILVYKTKTLGREKVNGWSDDMLRHPDSGAP